MIKHLLDKIFKLPPVEDRRDIRYSWFKKVFLTWIYVSDKDDTYIQYQLFKTCFVISTFLTIPYIAAFVLNQDIDLFLFEVKIPAEGYIVYDLLDRYNKTLWYVLGYVIFPFFLIKYRWNINPVTYNVMWGEQAHYRRYMSRPYSRPFLGLIFVVVLFMLTPYMGWGMQNYFFRPFYSESLFILVIFIAPLAIVVSSIPFVLLIIIASMWHCIGNWPIFKKKSSDPK